MTSLMLMTLTSAGLTGLAVGWAQRRCEVWIQARDRNL
jgi:hypothetical protein